MSHVAKFCVACCDVRHVASYLCAAKIHLFAIITKLFNKNVMFSVSVAFLKGCFDDVCDAASQGHNGQHRRKSESLWQDGGIGYIDAVGQ